jgi:hypothetical protein
LLITLSLLQAARTVLPPHRRLYSIMDGKGKAIPLQVWTGPEGSSRQRLPEFKTIGT